MSDTTTNTAKSSNAVRLIIIAGLVVAAFLGAYRFAAAKNVSAGDAGAAYAAGGIVDPTATGGATDPSAAGGSGCACCGSSAPTENGLTGELAEGTAEVSGDVQKIDVDLSAGYYNPNQIVLKAGVPAEITFGQGSGCTAQVQSEQLGFFEDLSAGPKTVKLPALEAGEYSFSCGMQMVFGKIVVK